MEVGRLGGGLRWCGDETGGHEGAGLLGSDWRKKLYKLRLADTSLYKTIKYEKHGDYGMLEWEIP